VLFAGYPPVLTSLLTWSALIKSPAIFYRGKRLARRELAGRRC